MIYFEYLFLIAGLAAVILMPLSILLLRITLDPRVRKQLPKNKVYDSHPDWYFGFTRAAAFGLAAIWNHANRSWLIDQLYDGFDVKSFANPLEKFIAYCMVYSLIFLVGGGGIYVILEMLGIVQPT